MSHANVIVALPGATPARRVELAVDEQMAPFDENGEWFRDGSRWDWWVIGGRYSGCLGEGKDIVRRGDLDLDQLRRERATEAIEIWHKEHAGTWAREYGIEPSDTAEIYAARCAAKPVSAYAFLSGHYWREGGRLGFFGTAKTECEVQAEQEPLDAETVLRVCVHRDEQTGAAIASFNSAPDWDEKFFSRFIERLSPDTWLVVVDYHV